MSCLIVEINEGKLQGYESKTVLNQQCYYAFKGIPYAKPPLGPLRFSVPQSPEPWEGVRDATRDCNICAQLDSKTGVVIGDEDCLYLNVYTPALPGSTAKLPVMLYLHSGGFLKGNSTETTEYGPDYLIEKNVILVCLNYRLGILGFLSLDNKDAPGNMGLRDQVQALKWVKKNIGQFGGDRNNVTIFGTSAGSCSIEFLLMSPMARGLFHKGIMHSGSSILNWSLNENMRELIMKVPQIKENNIKGDNTTKILELLKKLSCKDLVEGSLEAIKEKSKTWKGGFCFGFVPVVEKLGDWEPFLVTHPYELLSRGEFARIPIIKGFCSRESLLMRTLRPQALEKLKQEKTFLDCFPYEIKNNQKEIVERKFKNFYLKSASQYGEDDEFAIDFFSDVDFVSGVQVSALLMSKYNPETYLYEFAYDGNLNKIKLNQGITSKGASHGDDLGYILCSENLLANTISDTDESVRNKMVTMLTNFSKYGDPTPELNDVITTKWKPFTEAEGYCLLVDNQITLKPFSNQERARFFGQLYKEQHLSK